MSVFKIVPRTQQYDWGKKGSLSKVAQFAQASNIPGFVVDEESPYAELWMGTHPNAPSTLASSAELLADHLKENPYLIGHGVTAAFADASNGNLPFLFKVLSIDKALSIQVHPDKKTAEALHEQFPKIYKDPNHKPEVALALTPFRALCGFKPVAEIAAYLQETPELRALIPKSVVEAFLEAASAGDEDPQARSSLKEVFHSLMSASEDDVKQNLDKLVARYGALSDRQHGSGIIDLVLTLHDQFPGDIGIFCGFILNEVILKLGEAIFLGAGEPHAYVSGDCVECMANSDNVIRAGLTPKLRDVPNLVSNLTYSPAQPVKHQVHPTSWGSGSNTKLYDPPIPEFSILAVSLAPGTAEVHGAIAGPSIAILTGGERIRVKYPGPHAGLQSLEINLGDVFFIGADAEVTFENVSQEKAVLYRAIVEA